MKSVKFDDLLGKTIVSIEGMEQYSKQINFTCSDGSRYKMYHDQECCETVSVEDVAGDVKDILGSPITMAEESSESKVVEEYVESNTWTFYKLATVKGYVTIRWFGSSNGWYSESVEFFKLSTKDDWSSDRWDNYEEDDEKEN